MSKSHRIIRKLSDGVLRYEPVAGLNVEYEKGRISVLVRKGAFEVLGTLSIENAMDISDCLRAAALETQEMASPSKRDQERYRQHDDHRSRYGEVTGG